MKTPTPVVPPPENSFLAISIATSHERLDARANSTAYLIRLDLRPGGAEQKDLVLCVVVRQSVRGDQRSR